MRRHRPEVLILDHGELCDVRSILDELGVSYAAVGHEGAVLDVTLLVTSLSRVGELQRATERLPAHALRLVVADAHDGDLRGALARVDCDFVVRRPVDSAILRLITQRSGYDGPERRRVTRVALGEPISIRTPNQKEDRDAILAQLSIGGCGLVANFDLAVGTTVTLHFPRDLTSLRDLTLCGHVALCREVATADGPAHDLSVVFDALAVRDRVTLRAMMAGQPIGFRPDPDSEGAWTPADLEQAGSPPAAGERRSATRHCFRRRVLGGGAAIARVLLGHDLSDRGMRVARDPDFSLGDPVRVALYDEASATPLLLDAEVEREDEGGWFLRFAEIGPDRLEKLRQLLGSLESQETAPLPVVSEIALQA